MIKVNFSKIDYKRKIACICWNIFINIVGLKNNNNFEEEYNITP